MLVLLVALAAGPAEILEAACVKCHDAGNRKGGLDLSTRQGLLTGGESGPAVVPGRSRESLLMRLVTHDDEPAMPRKADKLPPAEIAALARWIDGGVPYARTLVGRADPPHWAWAPLRPAGGSLPPGRGAVSRTLIRRATFDLWGLPPTSDDNERYEDLVDRLLASPHYGERWGRHWLDVARYADSEGFEDDGDRKHAYVYRDFVIRALNEDMPFDQFVRWQLAGDELAPEDPNALAATGFLAAGVSIKLNPTDSKENKEKHRYDELDDFVSTTGAAFLGLTVGCARCHDHKYDPITSRDYYALVAAFIGTEKRRELALGSAQREWEEFRQARRDEHRERRMAELAIPDEDRDLLRQSLHKNNPVQKKVFGKWDAKLQTMDDELALTPEQRVVWQSLERAAQAEGTTLRELAVTEAPLTPPAFLLARGEPRNKVATIAFALPAFLAGGKSLEAWGREVPRSSPRAVLAAWLTDVDQGAGRVLARVTVNRLWQHHFGVGLVDTPNDLGTQATPLRNPELLDFLAGELVRGGWRLKPLHRLIMTSAAYRQQRPLRRLEAETVRDAILAVSGTLNAAMYGPAVKPPIPAEAIASRSKYLTDEKDGPAVRRRTVYLFTKRSVRNPMLEVFDAPDATASCGRRTPTTVPTQSLALMNDASVRARARDFARRLEHETGRDRRRQIDRAFRLAFGRPPRAPERAGAARYLAHASLVDFCHALFLTNEFLYVE